MSELPPQDLPSTDAGLSHSQRARLTQRVRTGLTALSLVGVVLIALPLVQLLRYQSVELKTLSAKREGLNPVARAVHLQRGLLAHRELAGQVLQGQERLEADRRQRQEEVDGRLTALTAELAHGRWDLALGEADDLRLDWLQLSRQVQAREIDAGTSDQAHGLLVEQTLQVVDLVATAATVDAARTPGLGSGVPPATMAVVRSMPRLVWMTAQLQGSGAALAADTVQRRLPLLENALARLLGPIEGLPRRGAIAASAAHVAATPPADPALLSAAAAAGAASERFFGLLRGHAPEPQVQAAGQAALQAQMRLFDLAHGQASNLLTVQARSAAQQRALLLGGLCIGLVIAAGLLIGLRRDLRKLQQDDQRRADALAQPADGDGQSGNRQQAEGLLRRLREGEGAAATQRAAASRSATPVDSESQTNRGSGP